MKLNKAERIKLKMKFGGNCAYCGKSLGSIFHADHVKPIFRGWEEKPERSGKDIVDNLFPACPRCNRAKHTFTIEGFRSWLENIERQLLRDEPKYRLLKDYNLI